MAFDKFGVVSFTTDAKVSPFVDYLEKGKVMATKCTKCGKVYFPPKADCPRCMSSDVEWVEVGGAGTLRTFTTVIYGPTGFEEDAPYTLGIADFDPGVRVLGRVSKSLDPKSLNVGMKVTLAPVKLASGHFIYEMSKKD